MLTVVSTSIAAQYEDGLTTTALTTTALPSELEFRGKNKRKQKAEDAPEKNRRYSGHVFRRRRSK